MVEISHLEIMGNGQGLTLVFTKSHVSLAD